MLLFPALLTHLGLVAMYDDEGIRALVALEMQLSGNFVTPTMFGEFYYNKPPLYNWILAAVFEITGRNDEFIARLPTIIFLLAFTASIWFQVKKHLSKRISLLTALAFLTCGRILFYDSMQGLIDIFFSWMMFLLFVHIFREGERERYGRLFAGAYLLGAIGFLLKWLPAVAFLGIALLTYFIWQKKWRKLISWQHLGGMALFGLLVGTYYFFYAQRNGLDQVFKTIFDESAKRTFVEHGFTDTLLHLFTFPFETLFHFLPWTLLVVYFFRKNARQLIFQNKFVTWNLLVLATTILPYWISVEVYPRYLFMFVPLFFTAFFYLHFENKKADSKMTKVVEMTFFGGCLLALITSLLLPFWEESFRVEWLWWKTTFLAAGFTGLAWLFWNWKNQRMLAFVLVLLLARVGFNWFVLPSRLQVECSTEVRRTIMETCEKIGDQPLHILEYSLGFQPSPGYYFTRELNRIVRPAYDDFNKEDLYLINPNSYPKNMYEEVARFRTKFECEEMVIGKLKITPTEWREAKKRQESR